MIHQEAPPQIELMPSGLMPSDFWERPDALVSTAKQDAHDRFFLDTPGGKWLSPGRIAHEVHDVTSAFVGETPLGRQVFLVAPGERTRPINQKNIPLDTHFAFAHALEREYLWAVQNAEDQHLITHEEAIRQKGARNQITPQPREALPANQDQDVIRDGVLVAAQATHVAIPAGIVGASIALAARRKDGYGRRFRTVGKVMYMTSSGITVGSLILSACTSVQSLPPQEVAGITPMPEQLSPTVDQARQAVASWMGVRIPLTEGEFGVFPDQAIFEVDPIDATGQTLKTLSLLNPDGRTTDPDLRYAMGLALIPSEKTGESVELPFLVQLGKNGEALMLGMFLDPAQSTKEVGVFRLNIVKDGRISPVTQEVVVTKVAGGVTIELRDISDPNHIVIYNLVSTQRESVPSQQSAVPSQVPDNNWIDKVVAFMSGAGAVQAAEPATPQEQLASATPLPSETPEPSATPAPAETKPTSCLDKGFLDQTVAANLDKLGFATADEAIRKLVQDYNLEAELRNYGLSSTKFITSVGNPFTENVLFERVLLLGTFKVSIPEGHANCVVIAYPALGADNKTIEARIVPLVSDVTVNGKWSGILAKNTERAMKFTSETEAIQWIADKVGKPIQLRVTTAADQESIDTSSTFNDIFFGTERVYERSIAKSVFLRSTAAVFASDPVRMTELAGSAQMPDLTKLTQNLRLLGNDDPGLFLDFIKELP